MYMYILFNSNIRHVCRLSFCKNEAMLLLNTKIPLTPKAVYILSSGFVFEGFFVYFWGVFNQSNISSLFIRSVAEGEGEFFCQEFEAHQ